MRLRKSSWALAILGTLIVGCQSGTTAPGAGPSTTGDGLLFTNDGDHCRDFLIVAPVTEENARKFVPMEFALVQPPTAFVELADCPGGRINGVESGPFRIAEAAVFITPPDGSSVPPLLINSAIYLLWQLDTHPELSRLKREAGFFGELVPGIKLDVTPDATLPVLAQGHAEVPFSFSPHQLDARLTPGIPLGIPLPGGLWHLGSHGLINTIDDIYETEQISAGVGTITLEPGTALAELFGATSVTGVAASGIGSFRNSTRLRPDIAATHP